MSYDEYVLHTRQKCTLAVAIAVCNTKPADLTIEEHVQHIRHKLQPDEAMDVDDFSVCSQDFEMPDENVISLDDDKNTQIQDLPDSLAILDGYDIEQLIKEHEIKKNTELATSKRHEVDKNTELATSKRHEVEKNTTVATLKGYEVETNTIDAIETEDTMVLLRDIDRVMPGKKIVQRNVEKMPSISGHVEVQKIRIIENVLVASSNSKAVSQEIINRKRSVTDNDNAKCNEVESQETQLYTIPNNPESYVSETQDVSKFDILEKYIFGVKKPKVQGKQDNLLNSQNVGRNVNQDNEGKIDNQNYSNGKVRLFTTIAESNQAIAVKSKEMTHLESGNMVMKKGKKNTIKRFQNTNIVDILLGNSQTVNANEITSDKQTVWKNSHEIKVKRQNSGIKDDAKYIKDVSKTTQDRQIVDNIEDANTRKTSDNANFKVQQQSRTEKSSAHSVGQKNVGVIHKNNGDKNIDSREMKNTKITPSPIVAIQHGKTQKAGNIEIITENNFTQLVENIKIKTHDIANGADNWDHIPNINKDTADITTDSGMGKTLTGTQNTQEDEFTFSPIIDSLIRILNSEEDENEDIIEKRTQEITPFDDNRKTIDVRQGNQITDRSYENQEFRSHTNIDAIENMSEDERSTDEEDAEADKKTNVVPYKVIMEMNKIKSYLKKSNEHLNTDSAHRSQRTQELSFPTEPSGWVDQAGHCMLDYIISCPMTQSNLPVVEQISRVLGKLIDKLHAECDSPSFLDDILQHITSSLKHIYEDDDVVFGKEERMERLLLLNRSIHVIIFSVEHISSRLDTFHRDVTSSAIYELTDIERLHNSCYLFHALEILLGRYFTKKQKLTKTTLSQTHSEASQPLSSTITDIWKKKWKPTLDNDNATKLDSGVTLDCMKISEILNRIVMDRMDGYCLVSFAALQCYNLLQS